jgi:hypothetical protein
LQRRVLRLIRRRNLLAEHTVAGMLTWQAAGSFSLDAHPTDPLALGVTVLLVLVAACASWIPARRAARTNPVEAMRADRAAQSVRWRQRAGAQ